MIGQTVDAGDHFKKRAAIPLSPCSSRYGTASYTLEMHGNVHGGIFLIPYNSMFVTVCYINDGDIFLLEPSPNSF